MAGKGMRSKVGVTMADGHVFASNAMLHAAARAHDRVAGPSATMGAGAGGDAMKSARAAALRAAPPNVKHESAKHTGAAGAETDMRKFGPRPVAEKFASKERVANLSHYEHVLDRMRDEGVTPTLQSELRAIRNQRSQEQNRSGLQGDLFAGFGAAKSTPKSTGRMSDHEYRAAMDRAGVKTAHEYAADRLHAIHEARKAVGQAREAQRMSDYYGNRKGAARLVKSDRDAAVRNIKELRSAAHSASKEAREAPLGLSNAMARERALRGDSVAKSAAGSVQRMRSGPPAALPQTKGVKLAGPQTVRFHDWGSDVKSVASSGGLHVHESFGHGGKGQYQITHAASGKMVLGGMGKTEALAALRGMHTGRTVNRLAEGGGKVQQAAMRRYGAILQRREAMAMAARQRPASKFGDRNTSVVPALHGSAKRVSGATAQQHEPRSASDWARRMSELRAVRPRPIERLYGKNPTSEQRAQHALAERTWNAEYRRASKSQKIALEQDNAAFRARNT